MTIEQAVREWNASRYSVSKEALKLLSDKGLLFFPGCYWIPTEAGKLAGIK